jgi:hypothetical protein
MIVQTAEHGKPHFIILQHDHARACGQLAAAFGNADFAPLAPREPLLYLVAHHDEGWLSVDAGQSINPTTHLPYHLTHTPALQLIATGAASPNHNESEHPLAGILSSMHTYGLYHGRYGLSDKIFIDTIGTELRPQIETMLQGELTRQKRLKEALRADAATADWADEAFLFHAYKLLQFFDTLGLYVHLTQYDALTPTEFKNVPQALGRDVTITARPIGDSRIALDPYPFAHDEIEMVTFGRYLLPNDDPAFELSLLLRGAPVARQTRIFTAGWS